MRKFAFKKLVRDNIVKGVEESGSKAVHRTLSQGEFVEQLKHKLLEEVNELNSAPSGSQSQELADIQEILDHLLEALKLSMEDLRRLQQQKIEQNGSFKNRTYIDYVEAKEDSSWVDYYLAHPDKYPEIL